MRKNNSETGTDNFENRITDLSKRAVAAEEKNQRADAARFWNEVTYWLKEKITALNEQKTTISPELWERLVITNYRRARLTKTPNDLCYAIQKLEKCIAIIQKAPDQTQLTVNKIRILSNCLIELKMCAYPNYSHNPYNTLNPYYFFNQSKIQESRKKESPTYPVIYPPMHK